MVQLVIHSHRLVLGWDLGRQLGMGTAGEGANGLALHSTTSTIRSLWRLPNFDALPVLWPFKICSLLQSTDLLLPMFPFSKVTMDKSFLAAQNVVWDDSFLMGECLSPRQAQSWRLSHPHTSSVTSGKEMESQSPGLSYGDNRSPSGWLWGVSEVMQVSSCPTCDWHSPSLPLPFLVSSLPSMGRINEEFSK